MTNKLRILHEPLCLRVIPPYYCSVVLFDAVVIHRPSSLAATAFNRSVCPSYRSTRRISSSSVVSFVSADLSVAVPFLITGLI